MINTPARRFVMLVLLTVVAAAVLMAPRRDEWLAVMREEDKHAQIIALLEPQLALNGNDPDLLAALGRSHAEIGDHRRAAELLERYILLRPEDGDAYARLADLYKITGDPDRRIAMLRRSLALRPVLSRAIELSGLYRENQQTDDELALLTRYEADLSLESGLLLRLARLHVARGDPRRALQVLMRPEILAASAQPMQRQDERFELAELLIGNGRSNEALRLGRQWIVQWHEPWLADRLLRVFVLHAPIAEASELAEAIVVLHPDVRFFLANGLAKMGARAVARHVLATWSKATPSPSMNEIAAFLSACRDQDEPAIVWRAFADVLGGKQPDEIVARYAVAIAAEFGIGALAPFWSSLPPAVIEGTPLLAARLAFHEHDFALTRWLLDRIDLYPLETSDRRLWIDLLTAVASPAEVFVALRERRIKGRLPPDLMADHARVAAGLGEETEYRAVLSEVPH